MEWDFKNGIPIYRQIIIFIKMRIANGTYTPGSRIPAVRELAVEANVNPNTMQRALAALETEGLLRTDRTAGRFVTEDADALKQLRKDLGQGFIKEMYTNLQALGMSRQEIVEAVEAFKGTENSL